MPAANPAIIPAIRKRFAYHVVRSREAFPNHDLTATFVIIRDANGRMDLVSFDLPDGPERRDNTSVVWPAGLEESAKAEILADLATEIESVSAIPAKLRVVGRLFAQVATLTPYISDHITVGLLRRRPGQKARALWLSASGAEISNLPDTEIQDRLLPPPELTVRIIKSDD